MDSIKRIVNSLIEKFKTSENTFMIIVPIIVGILGGLGAALLRFLIHFFEDVFWGKWGSGFEVIRTVMVPAMGAFVVGLIIYYFSSEAKGHGVPEVMEAIAIRNGIIRPRVVFGKAVASAITIGSGGAVGREGPIIQIGSAIGSTLGQFFKVSKKRMVTLVGSGAAAGIAAAFNAPIAGAMFAVEIILGDFTISQFSPIVISAVSATAVSRMFFGNYPAFMVPKYELINPVELFPYALLGFIAAFVGVLFTKTLYFLEDKFDSYKKPDYIKTTIGGLILGLIGLSFPEVFGVGYKAMDRALLGNMEIWLLLVLVFAKVLASSITLGSGSSGGIFAPSLFMGAMTGGFFGSILHNLFPNATGGAGAYALVAMSAVVASTTHAPITAILIIFEMTNDYKIILPLMIATTISSLVSKYLQNESIYTLKLVKKGINVHQGKEINILKSMKVSDVMRNSIEIIKPSTKIKDLIEKFISSQHNYFYVIDEKGRITEKISQSELSAIAPDYETLKDFVVAADIASPNLITVFDDTTLDVVMKEFAKENIGEIPVISRKSNKILGTVWRVDVIAAYNKEIIKRDLAQGVSGIISIFERKEPVEVSDNLFLYEIDVPEKFIGKKIKDLDIRKKYNIDIILINKKSGGGKKSALRKIPDGEYVFEKNDSLLILGEKKHVIKASNL